MPQTAPPGTALLRPAEAGAEMRVSRATVYRLINEGRLPVVYIGTDTAGRTKGRAARIRRTDLDAFIANAERSKAAS